MLSGHKAIIFRIFSCLVCIALSCTLLGCNKKLPQGMSEADLQTCDDTAAQLKQNYDITKSPPPAHPELIQPGESEITSPLYGSILPYGEPVVINFTQPPATPGVTYRHYKVIVTSIKGMFDFLDWAGNQYAVVTPADTNFQVSWTPPGSGKYIVYVEFQNIKADVSMGYIDPGELSKELELQNYGNEDFTVYNGPYSMAYSCIQIDVPKVKDINNSQPGTMMPLQNITNVFPTITQTFTFTPLPPTATATSTFTPTNTSTFTPKPLPPTFTFTFTPKPPTPKPPTPKPPTDVPTSAPSCGDYGDARTCEAHDGCTWVTPPTGGPGSCKSK